VADSNRLDIEDLKKLFKEMKTSLENLGDNSNGKVSTDELMSK